MFVNVFFKTKNKYNYGFQLGVGGYNSKQHVLLDKIIEKLTNFKIDPKRFEILKENVSTEKTVFKFYFTYLQEPIQDNLIVFILPAANYTFIAYTFQNVEFYDGVTNNSLLIICEFLRF
jgi:hypothetical protein